jgi:hypothetical protein
MVGLRPNMPDHSQFRDCPIVSIGKSEIALNALRKKWNINIVSLRAALLAAHLKFCQEENLMIAAFNSLSLVLHATL